MCAFCLIYGIIFGLAHTHARRIHARPFSSIEHLFYYSGMFFDAVVISVMQTISDHCQIASKPYFIAPLRAINFAFFLLCALWCFVAPMPLLTNSYLIYPRPNGWHAKWNVCIACARETIENDWYCLFHVDVFAASFEPATGTEQKRYPFILLSHFRSFTTYWKLRLIPGIERKVQSVENELN